MNDAFKERVMLGIHKLIKVTMELEDIAIHDKQKLKAIKFLVYEMINNTCRLVNILKIIDKVDINMAGGDKLITRIQRLLTKIDAVFQIKQQNPVSTNRNKPTEGVTLVPSEELVERQAYRECGKTVIIGKSGKAIVSSSMFHSIKTENYKVITRYLMNNLFSRKSMAAQSECGKFSLPSAKEESIKLDEMIINDIVYCVSKMTNVEPHCVHNTIIVKCADEYKMFKIKERMVELEKLKAAELETKNGNSPE